MTLEAASAWPWWLGALVLIAALAVTARRSRDHLGGSALLVGLLAAVLFVPPGADPTPIPTSLQDVAQGAPCTVSSSAHAEGAFRLAATCDGNSTEVVVRPAAGERRTSNHTAHHSVMYLGTGGGPETLALVRHVARAVRTAEAEGYRVPVTVTRQPTRLERWRDADEATRARLRVSAGLVVATLWVLLAMLLPLLRGIGGCPRALLVPAALAAVAVCLAPAKMRMVYGGYDLTTHLVDGVIPRYGPGALWFYGAPQWLLGGDHGWIQGLNRLYGLGSLAAVIALAGRWFPKQAGAREATAWLMVTLPILMAAHSCESIHAGPALGLLVSLWLWSQDEVRHPVAAMLPALAAAMTRPEMAVMVALSPPLIWALRGRPAITLRGPWTVPAVGVAVMLTVIIDDVVGTMGQMASQSAVELDLGLIGKSVNAATFESILGLPSAAPTVLLGLVVAAVVARELRPLAAPVLAFAVLWMASTGIDHTVVSLPRIQLVPLLLCLPLAGAAVLEVLRASRLLVWGLALFYLGGAVYSAVALWTPTNEDHEERLWRDAVAALPEGPVCVAAIGYGDAPPAGISPRHNPGYLLTDGDPTRELRQLTHLGHFLETCRGPVYALLGTRCHVAMRSAGQPAPGPEGIEACRRVRASHRLEPVIEREVPNRGDLVFPMYPASRDFTIGLYAVARPGR